MYIYLYVCAYVLYYDGKNYVMAFFSAIGFIYICVCVYAFVN